MIIIISNYMNNQYILSNQNKYIIINLLYYLEMIRIFDNMYGINIMAKYI